MTNFSINKFLSIISPLCELCTYKKPAQWNLGIHKICKPINLEWSDYLFGRLREGGDAPTLGFW
jgi:hypothetical protein